MSARIRATVVRKGQRWQRLGREARVVGVLEGYVIYRFFGASMHCTWWRDFESNFSLKPVQPRIKK